MKGYHNTLRIRKQIVDNCKISTNNLKPMPQLEIRCGLKGGLPFEYLSTDIYSGCLSIENSCYGNCTAALFWVDKGYNFGERTINVWDAKLFEEDIINLPKDLKWLRQGWVSDCSFSQESWMIAAQMAKILYKHDKQLLIITKAHTIPSIDILKQLARTKAEIRVSLSALDNKIEINRRLSLLNKYRNLGGLAVPYLMTAKYKNIKLQENQDWIVNYVIENDYIAGEHPLRISKFNILMKQMDVGGFYHPKYPDQYWFGRLLSHIPNFILPAPTHLAFNYILKYNRLSQKGNDAIIGIEKNLPTYADLKNNVINFEKELNSHAAYSIQK